MQRLLTIMATSVGCTLMVATLSGCASPAICGPHGNLMGTAMTEVVGADGTCIVRLRGGLSNSAQLVTEVRLLQPRSDEVNVLAIASLFGHGVSSGFDVAVPVSGALRLVTFGDPATVVWDRASSACARHG